jgi:hypothetical protein
VGLIPTRSFDDPNWESRKNKWWRSLVGPRRPVHTWRHKESGELVESYTMLRLNADADPLMRRLHKPDPKLGPLEHDKRSVIEINTSDCDTWQRGPHEGARTLIRLTALEDYDAGSDDVPQPLLWCESARDRRIQGAALRAVTGARRPHGACSARQEYDHSRASCGEAATQGERHEDLDA